MYLFAIAALALAGMSAMFLVALAARRVVLGAREKQRAQLERHLRPLALGLVDDGRLPRALPPRAAAAFAVIVGRYSRSVRGEASERIARFFEESGAVSATIHRLGDRRSLRRAEAAFALGEMGSPHAVGALLAALADPERDVRSAAARSLGRLGAVNAVEPLLECLVGGRVPRAVIGSALLAIGPDAVPRLLELVGSPEPEERATAVQLVGLLGDAGHARALMPRLLDTSADVRAQAVLAFGRLGAADAADAVRESLQDRVPFVRAAAATAAGLLGDHDAYETLLFQARGDLFDPARSAAEALRQIAPKRVAEMAEDLSQADGHLLEAAGLAAL